MPFKSKAQQRYLFAKKPKVAQEYADKTPKSAYGSLPQRAGKRKKRKFSDVAKGLGKY